MPHFQATQSFARPVAEVFDFFCRPLNLVRISPPELHMQLEQGPERIALGSRVALKGRRWGVPQRVVSVIQAFEESVLFADEQVEGPFRRWRHTHRFESLGETATRVSDAIEFEPPGGMLGLIVSASFIEKDLQWIFEFRRQTLIELLGPAPVQ
jgi:ligand-binding SRPBCC domain-containing protein